MLNHLIDRTKFGMVDNSLTLSFASGSGIPFKRITESTSVRAFFWRKGDRFSNTSFGWNCLRSLSTDVTHRRRNFREWNIQVHRGDRRLVLRDGVKRMINVGQRRERVFDFVCRGKDQGMRRLSWWRNRMIKRQ